jgi:hypothetical protein
MRTDKKLWRNRKARKELGRRLQSENPGLEVVHPHAAGVDVGNSAHYVAVRPVAIRSRYDDSSAGLTSPSLISKFLETRAGQVPVAGEKTDF